MQNKHEEGMRATVSLVFENYAVAHPEEGEELLEGETITFSLSDWEGDFLPRKGQIVILEVVQEFERGWRALRARPVRFGVKSTRKEVGRVV